MCPGTLRRTGLQDDPAVPRQPRSRNSDPTVTAGFGNGPLVTGNKGRVAPSAPTGPVSDRSELFGQAPRGPCGTET